MFNLPAITTHLGITANAITKIELWANVIWVKFLGGCRFVSKKVGFKMNTQIDHRQAANWFQSQIGKGNVWDKKNGETRLYLGKGYLRFAPETNLSAQVQYFLKSYEITDDLEKMVKFFNNSFTVVEKVTSAVNSVDRDRLCKAFPLYDPRLESNDLDQDELFYI